MLIKRRFIIQHINGVSVNAKYEPVKDIDQAMRFHSEEEAFYFLCEGHYKATEPEHYKVVPIIITFELEVSQGVQ